MLPVILIALVLLAWPTPESTMAGGDAQEATRTECGPERTCDAKREVCVHKGEFGHQEFYGCQLVPPGCEDDRSCACMGSTVCKAPFERCHDSAAANAVACESQYQ